MADDNTEELETFDSSNPEEVKKATRKAGRKKDKRLTIIKEIMKVYEGREYFYDLLFRCGIFGNPLVQGDPYATHFKIGEGNIGRIILADIVEAAPDAYVVMCNEGNERAKGR